MDHSRSLESSHPWPISFNFPINGTFTPYSMPAYLPHTSRQALTDPTTPDHHLTLSREKRNMKWSRYEATDVMGSENNSNISSNGRATRRAITLGNQLTKYTPQIW